ncbi:MAG: hypothetical protein Kow0068_03500 [Marinilabiliales bacterium]
MKYLLIVLIIGMILYSCKNESNHTNEVDDIDTVKQETQILDSAITRSMEFLSKWDIDGDGISDNISFDYTGGAHCCYKITVILSSDKKVREFPFEMDGGYEFDVDDSQPSHFNIKNYDNDSLPEIFMEIATYNSVPYELPKQWTEAYNIHSHYIIFDYDTVIKSLLVKDFQPE